MNFSEQLIRRRLLPFPKLPPFGWAITAWVVAMICVPIVGWVWGEMAQRQLIIASVLLQMVAVMMIVQLVWGWRKTGIIFLVVAVLSWGVEAIGTHTGIPFGHYHYTDLLQPQIGRVPLLIPSAWFMMLPPAWAIAYSLRHRPILFATMSAVAIASWDLYLDPQMVKWGFWQWDQPGAYFGIPLINYFGWFVTAFFLTALLYRTITDLAPVRRYLLMIYAITWFLEGVGLGIFWGEIGPGIVGGIAMGACLLISGIRR